MNTPKIFHPMIYEYLKKYQEDPQSRIFAPLAEAYRKAGFLDEAIDIAKEGLKVHPQFIGGKVALARALFDRKLYLEVIEELAPAIQNAPDNLVAQRLLADSYLILGKITSALESYKMLLFFNPQDMEVAQIVKELEVHSYQKNELVIAYDSHIPFEIRPISDLRNEDPFIKKQKKIKKIEKLQSLLQKIERYKVINEVQKQLK